MRRARCVCLLMAVAFLVACHTPTQEARRMVRQAERLADTLPDSTVHLIDSVLHMPAYLSERERMDIALLQAEALFGCRDGMHAVSTLSPVMDDDFFEDKPFLSTSPELERAAAYYARKKQYAKAAHAALYSGFVQQHYNEKSAAMQSFKDAERYGNLSNDSLCMAIADYNIGKMLYTEFMTEEALSILEIADLSFGNRYTEKAIVQNSMASCCILLSDYENAEHHLQLSLEYAEKGHSSIARIKAQNNLAVLFRQKKEYDKALAYLEQAKTGSETEIKFVVLLNTAKVYMAQGKMDSTAMYLQKVEKSLNTIDIKQETKASAYSALALFSESQGDYKAAYQYRDHCDQILLNVMMVHEQKGIYRIRQQYDYNTLKETMNEKVIHRQRIIMILCIVTALIMVAFAISQIKLAEIRKQEAEANANLFHFMEQNKALVESNMAHERKVIDTTQQLSDLLSARLKAMQKLDYCLKTPRDKIALKDLEKEVFGDGDHWEAVKEVLVALYPGLWETLKLKYPEMDEMELRVCMLSRLRLSRLAEATLLGISTSVLDKLRAKVRKTMGQEKTQ